MQSLESRRPLAVLCSGGLDSAILLGLAARVRPAVYPLYVRTGLPWEPAEERVLAQFVAALQARAVRPTVVLELPVGDLYDGHWSKKGEAPGPTAPDEEFYLPGRNVVLLAKALLWCRLHQTPDVALAVLDANPFPDATPEFFRDFAAVVSRAVGGEVRVLSPFGGLSKAQVIQLGRDLPLGATLSCVSPVAGRHCGACGKCAERGRAFLAAGVPDPTDYASNQWHGTTQRRATTRPWE